MCFLSTTLNSTSDPISTHSHWCAVYLPASKDRKEYNALLDGLLERLASFRGSAPSAGGGWRYQLLASWCLMHLIRPTVRPPIAVWHYYTECLSEGDGQPLQRLALGALKRLLLGSVDPAAPGTDEVSELLSSKAFLHPFLRALAYNHQKQATEGGLAGGDQWSLGVREVLQDSGRGDTRELVRRCVGVCVGVCVCEYVFSFASAALTG